jgi:hypothetical protein
MAWGTGTDSATYTPPMEVAQTVQRDVADLPIVPPFRPMAMDANAFDQATWELSFVVAIA